MNWSFIRYFICNYFITIFIFISDILYLRSLYIIATIIYRLFSHIMY